MKLKKFEAMLLTGIMMTSVLSGCGAMPSTGNGEANAAPENENVSISTEEEKTEDGQITLRVVDWSDGSAEQREEFIKSLKKLILILKLNIPCLR